MSFSQQQQVTVKAYYNDLAETQPEIRRFPIDISSNTDVYGTLETTIAQLNADYAQGQFTLQYIDEDNDRITFSSTNELRSAINNVAPGGTIKIFVKPKVKKVEQSNENNNTVHVGITCDGCQGPVVGIRYKCMECPDYDLCQTCSEKNLHPEHNMLKMTRPSHRFFGGHRRCGGSPGRGHFGGGRCGGGRRFWHHFMQQQQQQQQQQQGATTDFQVPSHMVDFLSQFKGKELAELIETHLPVWLRTENMNELLTQLKTGEQADKPVEQSKLLEHVGKLLREILSPFGIDCDYFVENRPSAKPTEEAKPKETEEGNINSSTEPKPTAPPAAEASASASASAPAAPPAFGNLLEQLQTMFAPMMQPQTPAAAPAEDQEAKEKKKIEECIERMTAMGFVDSNGVLTELIKAKKGDLNQVLDALNPRNYKN
jgi:hypothetical protein